MQPLEGALREAHVFKNVLLMTDLGPTSEFAFPALAALAGRESLTLHLFHAEVGAADRDFLGKGMREAIRMAALAAAMPRIEAQAEALRALGLKVQTHLEIGSAFDLVLKAITELDVDLVVIPSDTNHSLVRRVSNSTTSRALQFGNVPVMTMNPFFGAARASWPGFGRVLHPVSYGEARGESFTWLEGFAAELGATVEIATVQRPLAEDLALASELGADLLAEIEAETSVLVDRFLDGLVDGFRGEAVAVHLRHSHVGAAICSHAEAAGVGLIVMPNFDPNRVHTTIMGSVTEYVIRHAPCPVLVYDGPESAAERPSSADVRTAWLNEGEGLA
jgi:nucleotide-binding universal stress UspA family protein